MNMKKRIRKAFQNATPDVLGSVLSHCQLEKGTVIKMKKRKIRKILEYTAAAAAVVLLFGVGAGIAGLVGSRGSNIPGSTQSSSDIPTEANKWITEADALHIAEEYTLNLYTDPEGKPLSTAVLDKEASVYKVQVLYDTYDHEYEIDATNGEILNSQKKTIELTVEDGYIGKLAARNIAMMQQNSSLVSTDWILENIHELTIDAILKDGILAYRVEFYFTSPWCSYYINASSGEVIKSNIHYPDSVAHAFDYYDSYIPVGWRDARDIALNDSNISLSQLTTLKFLEHAYFTKKHYTIQFSNGEHIYEYQIDPNTGAIITSVITHIDEIYENKYIDILMAKKIAMILVEGADAYKYLSITLDNDIYKVTFDYSGTRCDAYINAVTGEIIEKNFSMQSLDPDETDSALIGRVEAKSKALTHASVTSGQLTALSIEYGNNSGIGYYLIKFAASDYEYQYKVHARTGTIISHRKNRQGEEPEVISLDDALNIALKYYGKTEEEIENLKCELQRESENAYYRITFTRRTYNYEIHIDAYTGEVLKSGWVIDLEGASLEDLLWTPGTWYNMALTCEYATPADIDLYCFFYRGFDDESSELTEAEQAFMESVSGPDWIYWGADRLPAEKMDAVLQEYFGITLNETNKVKLHWFKYWEETNCYYHSHTDTLVAQIEIERVENQPDGTICVYYHRNYPESDMVVTVRPNGDGYQILSNLPVAE